MDSSAARTGQQPAGSVDDEAALVAAARDDPAAFAELYRCELPRIYRYLRARTGSAAEAEDLSQQVFLQALTALPRYRERGLPIAAWLFRIARNAAHDAARRRGRQVVAFSWDDLPEERQPGSESGPELIVLQRESLERLSALLAGLSDDKRDLLALRVAAGLSIREIAAAVGKSEAAVRKQLERTLKRLKEQYDG
ncbi:MAG TPA: sigma-70 family RNA polymerase sigma factor [Thermomicrobiaceae bacterium]|nr:sigma-70 family RNA polymerase sigma factor [Thermomicrobiaceae bacterium]